MPVRRRTNRGKKNNTSVIKLEDESILSQGGDSDLDRIITWLEDFDMQFATRLVEFDDLLIRKLEEQKRIYSIQRLKIPSHILNNVPKQNDNSGNSKVVAETPINDKLIDTFTVPRGRTRKRSASVRSTVQKENSNCRTRSSSLNSRVQKTAKAQELKTPATRTFFPITPSIITPKMAPNAPVSVVRYPHQGELFAFSNTGSPVVVSAECSRMASLKVPLADGHVVSILPQPNSEMIDTLSIDHETKEQLKNLVYNINALIKDPQ